MINSDTIIDFMRIKYLCQITSNRAKEFDCRDDKLQHSFPTKPRFGVILYRQTDSPSKTRLSLFFFLKSFPSCSSWAVQHITWRPDAVPWWLACVCPPLLFSLSPRLFFFPKQSKSVRYEGKKCVSARKVVTWQIYFNCKLYKKRHLVVYARLHLLRLVVEIHKHIFAQFDLYISSITVMGFRCIESV